MNGYPVILELSGRLCVVVGAGPVGCRKAGGLLRSGARVRMISTTPPADQALAGKVELHLKEFTASDLDGAALAFAATGDLDVDRAVCNAARERCIPINLAAKPAEGDFRLPATVCRGDLSLSVSTAGRSPALSKVLRDRLAEEFGPEWAFIVELAGRLRTRKLTAKSEKTYSYKIVDTLVEAGLAEHVAAGRTAEINSILARVLGEAVTLEDLGLSLRDVLP